MQTTRLCPLIAIFSRRINVMHLTKCRHRCLPSKEFQVSSHFYCTSKLPQSDHPLPEKSSGSDKEPSKSNAGDRKINFDQSIQDTEKQWQEYEQELRDLNLVKRYYKLFKDYWYIGLPVAAVVSLFLFGSLYFIASLGDIKALIDFLRGIGVSEVILDKLERSQKLGSIAITLILYKLATPVRYFLIIYLMIFSTKILVRRGLVKPFPSKNRLKEIIKDKVAQAKDKTKGP